MERDKILALDGYELPEGRILGDVSWHEETKEWRALIVTHAGALAVAIVKIHALDNWYDRQV